MTKQGILTMKMMLPVMVMVTVAAASVSPQQRFLAEPRSVLVGEGEAAVRLDCAVADMAGSLQWTRDDFGLGTSRDLAGYTRCGFLL